MITFQILMPATAVALLLVLLLPWECCCVNFKSHVDKLKSQVETLQSHRESLIKWKKSVAKEVLNYVKRSYLVKNVKESQVWKKLEDIVFREAHSYTGKNHGPALGRLLRFLKQSATDSDMWEAQLWKSLGFQEALIYDPPGYEEPQSEDVQITHKRYEHMNSEYEQ